MSTATLTAPRNTDGLLLGLSPIVYGAEPSKYVEVGLRDDLTPARVPIMDAHILLGGKTGGGKTWELGYILAQIAARRHTAIIMADGKVKNAPAYYPRATSVALGAAGMRRVGLWLAEEVDRRYAMAVDLATMGATTITCGPLDPAKPLQMPQLVVVFDECAEMFKMPSRSEQEELEALGYTGSLVRSFHEQFHGVMTLAREALITIILATQRPDAGVIPPNIREATTVQIGLRTSGYAHTAMIFGHDKNVPAEKIREDQRGYGYTANTDVDGYSRFRGPVFDEHAAAEVMRRTAALRVELPTPDGFLPLPRLIVPPKLRQALRRRYESMSPLDPDYPAFGDRLRAIEGDAPPPLDEDDDADGSPVITRRPRR